MPSRRVVRGRGCVSGETRSVEVATRRAYRGTHGAPSLAKLLGIKGAGIAAHAMVPFPSGTATKTPNGGLPRDPARRPKHLVVREHGMPCVYYVT